MNAVRIRKQLTSASLEVPELSPFIGRVVEICVVEERDQVELSAVRFQLDDGLDLEPISEAVIRSGALSRLA